jgi:hypothetical protein
LLSLDYIDAALNGPEIAEEDILSAVWGERVFRPAPGVPNLTATLEGGRITFTAAKYPVPGAVLGILLDDLYPNADVLFPIEPCTGGPGEYTTNDGQQASMVVVQPFRVITPGHPFSVMVGPGKVVGCMLITGRRSGEPIPIVSGYARGPGS